MNNLGNRGIIVGLNKQRHIKDDLKPWKLLQNILFRTFWRSVFSYRTFSLPISHGLAPFTRLAQTHILAFFCCEC